MTSLSEKELSSIKDSLSEEELLVKKYQMLAEHAEDKYCRQTPGTFQPAVFKAVIKSPLKYWKIDKSRNNYGKIHK